MSTSTLRIDFAPRDLTDRYHRGAISAYQYATVVLQQVRAAYPFLAPMPARDLLRCIAALPEDVVTAMDGESLATQVATLLSLPSLNAERLMLSREMLPVRVFGDEQVYFGDDECIYVRPNTDPSHPGRRYVCWIAETLDADARTAGPWYAATQAAALVASVDYLQQFHLGEPSEGARR